MKTTEISTIRLEADEGMVLTDGKVYGTTIFLGKDRDINEFYEITKNEYEEIMTAQESSDEIV